MTTGEYLSIMTQFAKNYRKNCKKSIFQNKHMNDLHGKEMVTQKIIDAILVDFINFVGVSNCVDYGLNTLDLQTTDNLKYWERYLMFSDWKHNFSYQLRGEYDGCEVYNYQLNTHGDSKYFYIDFPRDMNGVKTSNELKLFYCLGFENFVNDCWESIDVPEDIHKLKEKLIELNFNIT